MPDLHAQVNRYLADAHSIEVQALAQLRPAHDVAGDPELAVMYREHLIDTEGHERTTRRVLEARDVSPSRANEGDGFVLFAELQPDTPGKLHARALSYEALELSAYELLRGAADRADDGFVVSAADRIAGEERAMMNRLERTYDVAVDASLRAVSPDDLTEELRNYLADAHAIEEQSIALLERWPRLAGSDRLVRIYEDHLAESRDHCELIQERLHALGGDESMLKDAALGLGALGWAAFFRGQPDTPGKLAAVARSVEHLEIGGYEQLRRVARRAGDEPTSALASRILEEERTASERLADAFGEAVDASLQALRVRWGPQA